MAGNETLRLVLNILYFLMAIVVASKVSGGCMQFFDCSITQVCKKAREVANARRAASLADGQTDNLESTE